MSDYLVSVVLGIVEGLTEFLPISSTAHLRIVESILDVSLTSGYWKMYTIVIQLGAILCVPIYFRRRIGDLLGTFPRGRGGIAAILRHPVGGVAVAFVVTAVPALLLSKVIGEHLESVTMMGGALLIGGIVMWVVDAVNARSEKAGPAGPPGRIRVWRMEEMGVGRAVWIGVCQILSAVFPGASRSMATIAGGQLVGMSRSAALEFSFFLSIPTMIVATGYDLLKSMIGTGENPIGASRITPHEWTILAIGFAASFVVAYLAVAWFMAWVRRRGFVPFAIYRIALGAILLALAGAARR